MPAVAAAEVKLSQDELKKQAGWKAVEYVKSGMKLGLGTGSTAAFAVDRIGQLLKEGSLKDIVGVPTSIRTYEQALSASSCLDSARDTLMRSSDYMLSRLRSCVYRCFHHHKLLHCTCRSRDSSCNT
jgi:hypothetical protein